jgi:hypothetical protein
VLLSSASIFAQNLTGNDETNSRLSDQISEILSDNTFSRTETTVLHGQVRFILNNEDEIVIMSVDTQSDRFESFVKSRLNYHGVQENDYEEGKMFTVMISVTS